VRAAERWRDRNGLDDAPWLDRDNRAQAACGLSLFRGVSAALLSRLGTDAADRPLLDTLLMFAPTFIQVCGALSDKWPAQAMAVDSVIGMGGMPDSCYMWRRDGALHRSRRSVDPVPTL
jgi:hypothetical protein